VSIACEYVAKIKTVDVATVAKVTSENALKLFPKMRDFLRVKECDSSAS